MFVFSVLAAIVSIGQWHGAAGESPSCAGGSPSCPDFEDDDQSSLLVLQKTSRRGCRAAGHNCNAGSCCAGLYCMPKEKNLGNQCRPPPNQLDPLPVGEIPPAGLQIWYTEKLFSYINNAILPPIVAAGVAEIDAYMQTPEFKDKINTDVFVGKLGLLNLESVSDFGVSHVNLSFQQGAGVRISLMGITGNVKLTLKAAKYGLAAGTYNMHIKDMSSLSLLIFVSSDDGALRIEVPEEFAVDTITIKTNFMGDTIWSPFTPFHGVIVNLIVLGFIPTINKVIKKQVAGLIPGSIIDGGVWAFPTIYPLEVSGYVQGVNTFSDAQVLSVTGSPMVVESTSLLQGKIADSAEGTSGSCRKEHHNCNVGTCCSGLICVDKTSGEPLDGKGVNNWCVKAAPKLPTQAPTPPPSPAPLPPGIPPFPDAMPLDSSPADQDSMFTIRLNQYIINGQFWYLQALNELQKEVPIPQNNGKNPSWLVTILVLKKKAPNTPCEVSLTSTRAPVLTIANGNAVVDLEIRAVLATRPSGRASQALMNYTVAFSATLTPTIQPPNSSSVSSLINIGRETRSSGERTGLRFARHLLSCRGDGHNCNAGTCCSGLTCVDKDSGLPSGGKGVNNECRPTPTPAPTPAPTPSPTFSPTPTRAPSPPAPLPDACTPKSGDVQLLVLKVVLGDLQSPLPPALEKIVRDQIPSTVCTSVALPGFLQATHIEMENGWLEIRTNVQS
eukprot:TRINITY_DN38084_c0_g1_i1.p1 TRINITY_DN38084_c0_g1~~TRINITY_DN38084_c0_g1_i1.p1  ORF type:complete len:724 (-),score=93.82 TRINITY_DN38084_c0_g1_i1:106-2277(-)